MKARILFIVVIFYKLNCFPLLALGYTSDNIDASVTVGCAPLSVSFSSPLSNVRSYRWDFGNGESSTVATPVILYQNAGNYDIQLDIVYNDNTTQTISIADFIQVKEEPQSSFNVSMTSLCAGQEVSFTNTSVGASNYLWDFGDGSNSTDETPTHIYGDKGSYTVTLIAFNEFGCSKVEVMPNPIIVSGVEELNFSANIEEVCLNNANINFSSTNQYQSYLWNFGDGGTSTLANPAHLYTTSGDYTVSLQVTGSNGCTEILRKWNLVKVHSLPEVDVEWTNSIVCAGQEVNFKNLNTDIQSIFWIFSDGYSTNEEEFSRVLSNIEQLSLTVNVTDANGCSNSQRFIESIDVREADEPDITISVNEGCAPLTVDFSNNTSDATSYLWEVNGNQFTDQAFQYTFEKRGQYSILVSTLHQNGCESTTIYDSIITVNDPVVIALAEDYRGCAPFEVPFRFNTEEVSNILWDFGDGNFSNAKSPINTYVTPGNYDVSVSYTNEFGCAKTLNLPRSIEVNDALIDYPNPSSIEACVSKGISFFGGAGRGFWEWDFGDGLVSSEPNPTHYYSQPGTYTVKLKTNNINGCPSEIPIHSIVEIKDFDFDFSFSLTDSTECPNFTMQFTTPPGDYQSILWSFGDGGSSTELNPSHEYTSVFPKVVSLTIINSSGCSKTKATIVSSPWSKCASNIPDEPSDDPDDGPGGPGRISFVHNIKSCSAPFELSLINPRPTAASWHWDFGDGNSSTEQNPTHIYQNTGQYVINLLARNVSGAIDSVSNYIGVNIFDQNLDFTFVENPACEGVEVAFTNTGSSQISWNWDFGDSTSSILSNPVKNYTEEGVYPVSLISRDTLGCVGKIVKNVIVGSVYPQFDYSETICFDDDFTIQHNLIGFLDYVWDFGDGTVIRGENPQHNYQESGAYSIKLTTVDQFGCEDDYDLPYQVVVNKPVADFEIIGETGSCNSLRVLFRNRSSGAERWLWDFGNGTTSGQENPSVLFLPGSYTISLTSYFENCSSTIVRQDFIQVDSLQADFSFIREESCLPSTVQFFDRSNQASSWLWHFGDGKTSTAQNPIHTYEDTPTEDVTLMVESANGCTSEITRALPRFSDARFKAQFKKGCLPHTERFTDLSSDAVSWFWNFGDGSTSTDQNPTHEYTSVGRFDVTLITKSLTGCYDTIVAESIVKTGELSVDFSADSEISLCAPLVVKFNNLSVGGETYFWDFGDGSTSEQANPTHVYSKVGQFDVTLIGFNDVGCRDTITYENLITSQGPQAAFTMSDSVVCHPQEIQFTDQSASAVYWQWFFGDGNVSYEQHPKHTYAEPGSYAVSLLARDDNGCDQLVVFESINVYLQPEAHFEINEFDACQPATLELVNNSTNLQNHQFQWDFGNGTLSNETSPDLVYNLPGTYKISLTVTNEGTCSDTFEYGHDITVRDTFHLKEPDILQLSVSEEDHVVLTKQPYTRNNFKYEVVFRRQYGQQEYQSIDTLYNQLDSMYIDTTVNASQSSYEYKLQSYVYCADTVELTSLNTYQSIFMEVEARENDISLQWTPYKGHEFDSYAVMRKASGEEWKEVAQVPIEQNKYIDSEELCPVLHAYRVEARNLNSSPRSSSSNVSEVRPVRNVFLDQRSEIIRTTILEDQVFTEWTIPEIAPEKVLHYEVWRSENEAPFKLLNTVPKGITNYLDSETDRLTNQYTYKIDIANTCNVDGPDSNLGSSILLQKETKGYLNKLFWNSYLQWEQGVLEYRLQKKNENGEWETTDIIPPSKKNIVVDLRDE